MTLREKETTICFDDISTTTLIYLSGDTRTLRHWDKNRIEGREMGGLCNLSVGCCGLPCFACEVGRETGLMSMSSCPLITCHEDMNMMILCSDDATPHSCCMRSTLNVGWVARNVLCPPGKEEELTGSERDLLSLDFSQLIFLYMNRYTLELLRHKS